jgi:hypothetical protein
MSKQCRAGKAAGGDRVERMGGSHENHGPRLGHGATVDDFQLARRAPVGRPRLADGSWWLRYPFHAIGAFNHPHEASYAHLSEATLCRAGPCLNESPAGCVAWGPSALQRDTKKSEIASVPDLVAWTWNEIGEDGFDMKSTDPALFSKQIEFDIDRGCAAAPRKGPM